jgi:hypothetical protein
MSLKDDCARVRATLAEIDSDTWASPLERVGLADSLTTSALWVLSSAVNEARAAGCSWEKIAAMLGVTKQAAQQRFG